MNYDREQYRPDKTKMSFSVLGSAAGHFCLILILLLSNAKTREKMKCMLGGGNAQESGPQGDGNGGHKEPYGEIIDIEPMELGAEAKAGKPPKDKKKNCTPFFGGIGITMEFNTNRITRVHSGYPAEAIGIKEGDILVDQDIKGEVGTTVVVHIIRNGQPMTFTTIRDRICVEDLK